MLNISICYNGILTNEQIYKLAYALIPKQSSGYIKYLKKNKQNDKEIIDENINSNNEEITINLFNL